MSKYCVKCGEALSEEALFCGNCGNPKPQNKNNIQYQSNQQQLYQTHNQTQSQQPNQQQFYQAPNQSQFYQAQNQQPNQQQFNQPQYQAQYQPQFVQPQNTYNSNGIRKKPTKLLFLLIPIAIVVGIFIWNQNKSTPEKTIQAFEDSYNNMDADGMLECIEPKVQSMFKGATALLSGFTGYDVSEILEGVLSGVSLYADEDSKPQIKLKIIRINYISDTQANAKVDCSYYDGEENSDSVEVIPMIKVGGKWYLSMNGPSYDSSVESDDSDETEE